MKRINSQGLAGFLDRVFGTGYWHIEGVNELTENRNKLCYLDKLWLKGAKVVDRHESIMYQKETILLFPPINTEKKIDFVLADLNDESKRIQAFIDQFYTSPHLSTLLIGYEGWGDAERTEIGDTVLFTGEYLPLENRYTLADHRPHNFKEYLNDIVRVRTFENISLREREHRPKGKLQLAL